ncbi:MAG: glycosyltransferase, partial [Ruthenibacterium sp.]
MIIPCYNEEENLERVIGNLRAFAPDVDYLIVND